MRGDRRWTPAGVSRGHLRHLATAGRRSLSRDSYALALSTEGIKQVPFTAAVAVIIPGKVSRAIGPVSLGERLEDIAAFPTGILADGTSGGAPAAAAAAAPR